MNLAKLADVLDKLDEFEMDSTDLYVIAQYKRAKERGAVTIMNLVNGSKLSRTLMHRRIKRLIKLEVLAKEEHGEDMRFKQLTDGRTMQVIEDLLN